MNFCEPRSEFIRDRLEPDYYLSHVIWRNSYGSFQPETGVRPVRDGKVVRDDFRLIQHYCADFDYAEPIILRALRKGWDSDRIARVVEWLSERRKRRPQDPLTCCSALTHPFPADIKPGPQR